MNPSSVDVLFEVTDAAGDITVATDGLDGVTICDVRLNPPVELDWLVAFCENTNLDDTTDGVELELSLDNNTALDNRVDSFPDAVAREDTTPGLKVPEGVVTVEECNDTLVDSCIVALFEAAKLDDTPTEPDTVAKID